jgi:hypothetical protein
VPRPIREHSFGVTVFFAAIGLLMLIGLATSIIG